MMCECGKCEATIHEVVIVNGEVQECHLCEACAIEQGIQVHPHAPVSSLTSTSQTLAQKSRPRGACESCGMTFEEFRKGGLLGCPSCYESFAQRLEGLVERAHQGAAHHVGKVPARAAQEAASRGDTRFEGNDEERAARLAEIQTQLDRALRGEQYERAALLRDELKRLVATRGIQRDPGIAENEP